MHTLSPHTGIYTAQFTDMPGPLLRMPAPGIPKFILFWPPVFTPGCTLPATYIRSKFWPHATAFTPAETLCPQFQDALKTQLSADGNPASLPLYPFPSACAGHSACFTGHAPHRICATRTAQIKPATYIPPPCEPHTTLLYMLARIRPLLCAEPHIFNCAIRTHPQKNEPACRKSTGSFLPH